MTVLRLTHEDLGAVWRLLEIDPVANVDLLDLLEREGLPENHWLGVGRPLRAVAYAPLSPVPRIYTCCVPFGDGDGCREIGALLIRHGLPFTLLGTQSAAEAAWEGLGRPRYRIQQTHLLMVCYDVAPGAVRLLRPARHSDGEPLLEHHISLLIAELDPLADTVDLDEQRAIIAARVDAGSVWVLEENGELVFSADVSTDGTHGARVADIFVPPEHRGQRIAQHALRTLCGGLLKRRPRVTLTVQRANTAAVRCYTRVGFRSVGLHSLMTW